MMLPIGLSHAASLLKPVKSQRPLGCRACSAAMSGVPMLPMWQVDGNPGAAGSGYAANPKCRAQMRSDADRTGLFSTI